MADRWSTPSGSVGQERFRVWPDGADSYDHLELADNWDHVDGIIGSPPSGMWPPTEGINGGIYKLIKDILDRLDDLELPPDPGDDPVLTIDDKYVIGYGTVFPSNPPEGKHFVLVNNATNPSWAFHCRYVPTAGWVVNGQTPIIASAATTQNLDSFSLGLALPRVGQWRVQGGGTLTWNPDPGLGGHLTLNVSGGASAFLDAGIGNYAGNRFAHGVSVATNIGSTTGGTVTMTGMTQGAFANPNSYSRIGNAWLKAWPTRLS